jgi:hypothetical protein
MTPQEIRDAIQDILSEHDAAIHSIREANEAMKVANAAMGSAISRHDDAIVSALAANRAALKLLNRLNGEGSAA